MHEIDVEKRMHIFATNCTATFSELRDLFPLHQRLKITEKNR